MKKIIALLLCLVLAFSVVGCGKDKTAEEPEAMSIGIIEEGTEETKEPVIIEGVGTQEDFVNMINEFNTTEDPERKEELGKIIQEVLENAEEAAAAAE